MSIKQISVFLENKPGTLMEMTSLLAEKNVDLRALSLAETKDFGIARLITDDDSAAMEVLKEGGFVAKLTSVLAFAVPDEPGGLLKLLQRIGEAQVNIEYMYSFLGGREEDHAYMIFRVAHTAEAEEKLKSLGLEPITSETFE